MDVKQKDLLPAFGLYPRRQDLPIEDEYRKHAERRRLLAEASHKPTDRAFWLCWLWQLLAQDSEEERDPDSRDQKRT
jgi:hypothetical protein